MQISITVGQVESSMVDSLIFYWEEWDKSVLLDYPSNVKGQLRVTFKNNAHYKYSDVALLDVLQIVASESIGTAFNDIIVKKGYRYEKISLSQA